VVKMLPDTDEDLDSMPTTAKRQMKISFKDWSSDLSALVRQV
jgi:hypothetical protein